MYKLLLLLGLVGCTHTHPTKDLNPRLERAEIMITRLSYNAAHDKCFITYNKCMVVSGDNKNKCWDQHEKCVIAVWKQYKNLLK